MLDLTYYRYHCLLAKHHPDNKQVTAIPNIVALLSSATVSPPVVTMIMDLVECLLMEPDYEPEGDVQALKVNNVRKMKIMNENQFTGIHIIIVFLALGEAS